MDAQRLAYVTRGPNVSKNHIACKCPFCGDADPSEHMGLSLKSPVWGCLRNAAHRGKNPAKLVAKLLGCSWQEATRIVGSDAKQAPTLEAYAESVKALQVADQRPRKRLIIPREFKPLLAPSPFAAPFREYLEGRGYRESQIRWLATNYELYYTTRGKFAYRVIALVRDRYGELLSWTGRAIRAEDSPRYKTLTVSSEDETIPCALLPINDTVLGLPLLWRVTNPRVLVIVEGPFDAFKISAFGHPYGVYGAALFGLNAYPSQVAELQALSERFDKQFLLLDGDAMP